MNSTTEYLSNEIRRARGRNLSRTSLSVWGDVTFLSVANLKFCDSMLSEIATERHPKVPSVVLR